MQNSSRRHNFERLPVNGWEVSERLRVLEIAGSLIGRHVPALEIVPHVIVDEQITDQASEPVVSDENFDLQSDDLQRHRDYIRRLYDPETNITAAKAA